jgi:hypothetical protein
MKKLLTLTTATLLLSATHATSQSLPPDMRGLWCHAEPPGNLGKTERYVRGRCRKEMTDNYLEVGVRRLEGHEWRCDIRKIVIVGRAYEVMSRCGGEGDLWDEKSTLWLEGRHLVYRRVTSNERPGEMGPLECRDHKSTPPEPIDTDRVVTTLINFDDTFAVTHVTRSGKTYVRGDQYRDIRVWMNEMGTPYWSGVWKRDPNKRMTGSLVWEGDANRYVEEIRDGGRLETTIVSTCTQVEDGR